GPVVGGPVVFDIQAVQSLDHRERGVARYVFESARAIEDRHPGWVGQYLLNPDLGPAGGIEPLVATGKVVHADACSPIDGGILHVASPFELAVPIERVWPAWASRGRMRLVVTLFDLIPEVFADFYLADPGLRRRYRARQQLIRAADHVLAISQSTADDGIERLGLD